MTAEYTQPTGHFPRIVISASTSWYVWNFRRKLLSALVDAGWNVTVLAPEDEHSRRLDAIPRVEWRDWPLSLFGSSPIEELGSLLKGVKILRHLRPHFVINHGIKPNIYLGVASRVLRIPYANSVTGLGMRVQAGGFSAAALARLYALSCNGAQKIFVQNLDDMDLLRTFGLSPEIPVIRTIGSGVDLSHFALAPMPDRGTARTFIFAGRLQRDKGIYEFVEAARSLRSRHPEVRFVIVGSTRHANRDAVPSEMLSKWGDEGISEFAGHQDDIRPWISSAHVLVLPSHGGEGVPKVLLEAAALGRPVIASNVPGCRDAVVPNVTGCLHEPRDTGDLVKAISRFVDKSDEEIEEMGRAMRKDAEDRFSDEVLLSHMLAMVQNTLSRISRT